DQSNAYKNNTISDFFFQAEDGIRDFHVTGVQTCALPISNQYVGNEYDKEASLEKDVEGLGMHIIGEDNLKLNKRDEEIAKTPEEIGRASCRERVKMSVGGVALKKKRKGYMVRRDI